MKITIEGTEDEITALVLLIQGQYPIKEMPNYISLQDSLSESKD